MSKQQQMETGEAEVLINETEERLQITIPGHLKVTGMETKNGNTTIATTHGNITTVSGLNFSLNLWKRGTGASRPRRNVTLS
jgi:hypothetical protein